MFVPFIPRPKNCCAPPTNHNLVLLFGSLPRTLGIIFLVVRDPVMNTLSMSNINSNTLSRDRDGARDRDARRRSGDR